MVSVKTCTNCMQSLPLSSFSKDSNRKDGLNPWCRNCVSTYMKEYRLRNHDRETERARKWTLDNPERTRELRRARYHRKTAVADALRWQRANPERRSAISRKYAASDKGIAAKLRSRYALDAGALEWAKILRNDPCSYCGGVSDSIDHIIPQAQYKDHSWSNLTAACRLCNSSKQDKPLIQWLATRINLESWTP